MPMIPNDAGAQWETLPLPLSRGVDLRTPERGVTRDRLITLYNARFEDGDIGFRKRRGHLGYRVKDTVYPTSGALVVEDGFSPKETDPVGGATGQSSLATALNPAIPKAGWLYGYGVTDDYTYERTFPDAGVLFGGFKQDNQIVAWDGWRLWKWASDLDINQGWVGVSAKTAAASLPAAKTTPTSKIPIAQTLADVAIADNFSVTVYYNSVTQLGAVDVYDRKTRALLATHTIDIGTIVNLRCVPCKDWVHVFASTTTDVEMFSLHESNLSVLNGGLTTLGTCATYFDVKQLDDEHILFCKKDIDNRAKVTVLKRNGLSDNTYHNANKTLPTAADVNQVAIARHPQTMELCLLFQENGLNRVKSAVFTAQGVLLNETSIVNADPPTQLTVEANYATVNITGTFYGWAEFTPVAAGAYPYILPTTSTRSGAFGGVTMYHLGLAAHAHRVGDKVFFLARRTYKGNATSKIQRTVYLYDQYGYPCGVFESGTATDTTRTGLPSVNFNNGQSDYNRTLFHTSVIYRTRLDSVNNDQYDEDSIKLVEINYLPRLRTAQQGRTVYSAGALVHAFDGTTFPVEAGFLEFPEEVTGASSGTGGNLVPGNNRRYRVRWAWKNAAGEEVVSASIPTAQIVVGGGHNNIVLTIPTLTATKKTGAYALVYATANNGTLYYLASSRDPNSASCPKNSSAATITFTDTISDANLQLMEQDLSNSGELEPFAPPACEVIAAGKNRLWVAGGAIPPGTVLPSKLASPGLQIQFNGYLATDIYNGFDPVSGIGFMGLSTLIFKRDTIFAIESDGPSNLAIGSFDTARAIVTEAGALTQETIAVCSKGIVFVSAAGPQILATNYQLITIGDPVLPAFRGVDVATVLPVAAENEIRFYMFQNQTVVFNLSRGEWSTWSVLATGALLHLDGKAVVFSRDGYLLKEEDNVWSDNGVSIELLWRTSWLHSKPGSLEFQRLRRFAVVGTYRGVHSLRTRVFYDGRDYPDDTHTWDVDADLNASTWGASTWGAGLWGDVNGSTMIALKDSVYAERWRPRRQKCSCFSIEFSDLGQATESASFSELAVEVGNRHGLVRLPTTTAV